MLSKVISNRFSLSFILGNVVGLLFVGQNIVAAISFGRPIKWEQTVLFEMIYWYAWAALTPAILWYAARHRNERRHVLLSLSGHSLFGLLTAVSQISITNILFWLIVWKFNLIPSGQLQPWRAMLIPSIIVGSITSFWKYWVLIGIYYAFDYYHKYQERVARASHLETLLAQAELQNLKMQLHPHFLFNTLHAVSMLMLSDVEAANRMLARLSDLLRATLDNIGTQEVTLKQELDLLQRYLEIEQIRFSDRLKVSMEVEPSTLDAYVPYLILQPIVENAIRHGIAPRAEGGLVVVSARRTDGTLRVQVCDDGLGVKDFSDKALTMGVGLANTKARLEHLYGNASDLNLARAEIGGLKVTVAIPFH